MYISLETSAMIKNSVYYQAEAEKGVLGCVLVEGKPNAMEGLYEDDFYGQEARCVARALRSLGEKTDPILLRKKLSEFYPEQEGRLMQYAFAAMDAVPTTVLATQYRRIVRECGERRRLAVALKQGLEDLGNAEIAQEVVVDDLLTQLKLSGPENAGWLSSYDVAAKTMDYIEQVSQGKIKPIQTNLNALDKAIGGFYKGELTILGARPAVGKSAFANYIAVQAAKQGKKVCVCSREMSDVQYGQRLLSSVGDIEGRKIRLGIEEQDDASWRKLGDALNKVANLSIDFLFTVATIEDLRREVRRKVLAGDCDLLIVDYLQLMRTKKNFEADHLRVGYISKVLKEMTLDLNLPILALAQVKRAVSGQKQKMPSLDDLKDSGSIEQDADGVIFLHRPQESDDPTVKPLDKDVFARLEKFRELQYIAVQVAKQRQGETGTIGLVFNPQKMSYIEVEKMR